MVRPCSDRRGASSLGCLVSLALLVGALYYGVHIGGVYFRLYELQDEMQQQANFASHLTDQVIRLRLLGHADSLLGQTPDIKIERTGRPNRITIQAHYTESVELPLFKHTFVLRPRVEAPL
jgi:hypothetical protein